MSYQTDEPIKLTRDCQVVAVPAGHTLMLPQGTEVMITQSLGRLLYADGSELWWIVPPLESRCRRHWPRNSVAKARQVVRSGR